MNFLGKYTTKGGNEAEIVHVNEQAIASCQLLGYVKNASGKWVACSWDTSGHTMRSLWRISLNSQQPEQARWQVIPKQPELKQQVCTCASRDLFLYGCKCNQQTNRSI